MHPQPTVLPVAHAFAWHAQPHNQRHHRWHSVYPRLPVVLWVFSAVRRLVRHEPEDGPRGVLARGRDRGRLCRGWRNLLTGNSFPRVVLPKAAEEAEKAAQTEDRGEPREQLVALAEQ